MFNKPIFQWILSGLILTYSVCNAQIYASITTQEILDYASEYSQQMYTYNYINYQEELKQQAQHFLKPAWQEYRDSIDNPKYIQLLTKEKVVVTSDVIGKVRLTSQSQETGNKQWLVEAPMKVIYNGYRLIGEQELTVELLLQNTLDATEIKRTIKIQSFKIKKQSKMSVINKAEKRLEKCKIN